MSSIASSWGENVRGRLNVFGAQWGMLGLCGVLSLETQGLDPELGIMYPGSKTPAIICAAENVLVDEADSWLTRNAREYKKKDVRCHAVGMLSHPVFCDSWTRAIEKFQ